jgi:hypothetical protein
MKFLHLATAVKLVSPGNRAEAYKIRNLVQTTRDFSDKQFAHQRAHPDR